MWPFVLPAALLVLFAGMSGRVNWVGAAALLVEGVVLLMAWMGAEEKSNGVGASGVAPLPFDRSAEKRAGIGVWWAAAELVLAGGLVVSGAWAAAKGAVVFSSGTEGDIRHLVVVMVLSPLLVAPMMFWGSTMAGLNRGAMAMSSVIGVVLLNLCLLLPMAALIWYPVSAGILRPVTVGWLPEPPVAVVAHGQTWDPDQAPTTMSSTAPGTMPSAEGSPTTRSTAESDSVPPAGATAIVFPMSVWRVDTILLVVLGVMLLPWGLGGWTPGRIEGTVLVLAYLAYAVVQTTMVRN
jgi:hypothetical protein